jgi:hypothetical protein
MHTHVTSIRCRAIHNLRSYVSSMGKYLSNDAVLCGKNESTEGTMHTVSIPQHLTKERQILDNELYLGKDSKDPAS